MAYVKWVANADRHNDWTSVLLLKDGTRVEMGVPINLEADVKKELEAQGRQFENSSKDEFTEYNERPEVLQPPGADVYGTAPIFVNSGVSNQTKTDQTDQEEESPTPSSQAPQQSQQGTPGKVEKK